MRAEIDQFVILTAKVEQRADRLLRGFIAGMKDWVRGYFDWVAQDTQRYDAAFAEQDADDRQLLLRCLH